MKTNTALLLSLFLITLSPANAGEIEIIFSKSIQDRIERIDRIEKEREKDFRKHRHYDLQSGISSQYANKSRFANTEWANESLIPNIEDYGLKNLLHAMMSENLSRLNKDDFTDTIRISLDHISVSHHPLASLSGGSYTKGKIEQLDAVSGEVIKSFDITSNVSTGFTVSNAYDGDGFAFHEIDESTRIGPTLSSFARHSLAKLFPEDKDKFAKPISVKIGASYGIKSHHSSQLLRKDYRLEQNFYSRHYY